MFFYFSQGLLLGGAAASQPGPFQAYLLSQTLKNGWGKTVWAAFAPLISDGPIIILVLLILVQTPDWFLNSLRIVGGFFLLYLAWKALVPNRNDQTFPNKAEEITAVKQQNMLEAALMNALSPGPYIFWATIAGPMLIKGWQQSAGHGLSFLLGFYGMLIGGFIGFVTFFAFAKRLDPTVNRILNLISGFVLMGFGLYQLWQGGNAILG